MPVHPTSVQMSFITPPSSHLRFSIISFHPSSNYRPATTLKETRIFTDDLGISLEPSMLILTSLYTRSLGTQVAQTCPPLLALSKTSHIPWRSAITVTDASSLSLKSECNASLHPQPPHLQSRHSTSSPNRKPPHQSPTCCFKVCFA